MQVQHILKSKSDDGVATIAPGSTVRDAVAMLSHRRIGAVIVSPDGKKVSGILSERDIVRELGQRGPVCMDEKVDDMMTTEIVGCRRSDSSDMVLAMMTKGRFRHMPVMEDDEMIGLISIGDVVKAQLAKLSMEMEALESMIKGF